jgi:hypothetical protein
MSPEKKPKFPPKMPEPSPVATRKAKPPKGPFHRAYNQAVEAAELADIVLIGSRFDFKPDYFEGEQSQKLLFGGGAMMFNYDPEDGTATVVFRWWLQVKREDESLFDLEARFLAGYKNLIGQDEEAIKAFVARVGRFATYPYFRSFVSSISWLSGAQLPILPILKEHPRPKRSDPPAEADPPSKG